MNRQRSRSWEGPFSLVMDAELLDRSSSSEKYKSRADGEDREGSPSLVQSPASTTLSWDSGYNEVNQVNQVLQVLQVIQVIQVADEHAATTTLSDREKVAADLITLGERTLRTPSVVVSSPFGDMDDDDDVVQLHDGYLSHSSSIDDADAIIGQERDASDWNWSSALRNSSGLSHEVTRTDLLSIQHHSLSHCSSSSSLATLDMEPCCGSPGHPAPMSSFQHSVCQKLDCDLQSMCSFQPDNEEEVERLSAPKCDSDVQHPLETVHSTVTKISPWRKVRSAVQWSPFVQTFRRQRYPWVQLAGHQGNFKIGGERGTILKKLCPVEENCFQLLMQDPLRPFIPKYKGHIIADDGERNRLN